MMEAMRDISMFLTRLSCSSSYGETSYSLYTETTVNVWSHGSNTRQQGTALEHTCKPDRPVHPEAVLLPPRATLTLADLKGAVTLQRVLSLQAFAAGVWTERRHGLLSRTVLQQAIRCHAGLLLDAGLLRHQAVQRSRDWSATWRRGSDLSAPQPSSGSIPDRFQSNRL